MTDSTWFHLKRSLASTLSKDEFQTWFSPLRVRSEDEKKLVLEAPNDRFMRSLEASYRPVVDRTIAGLRGSAYEVLFSVADQPPRAAPAPAALSLENGKTNATKNREISRFNERYRFDSFVVGSSNQFASAASRAVAESPGRSYNPLYLYGGVGLGKTHLLHAIAQYIRASDPDTKLLYLSAEQFVNELINSIRFDRMPAFRERYRTIDVLLVDDVQFLANKERTQEEFFHTFNTLYTQEKQIILSSDCSPKNIPTLEERLRSRFEWGLIADIQSPDLETKVAILERKAEQEGHDLPERVALFIAQQVKSNVRELEGHLNRVLAFASLTGRPLDLDLARETLRDILPLESHRTGPGDVIRSVAKHYGLKLTEIKSRNNSKQIAFPRQVAMYLCKQLTELSYPEIGKQFNDKHHSTVMYSVEKISRLRSEDPDLDRTLTMLADQIG
jgi:chromosomal replication initiator protein